MSKDTIENILNNKGYNPAINTNSVLVARTMEQISYAMAYMGLEAEHLNIDSCIIGAFSNELTGFNDELNKEVKKVLNIPENTIIAGMLTLGYRKETVKNLTKKRKAFEETVSFEKYGEK
jgi:nitroreductase